MVEKIFASNVPEYNEIYLWSYYIIIIILYCIVILGKHLFPIPITHTFSSLKVFTNEKSDPL